MEMLSQIQVRKSEAFSYISFSASEIGGGGGEKKKKKSGEIRQRGQMIEQEKEVQ